MLTTEIDAIKMIKSAIHISKSITDVHSTAKGKQLQSAYRRGLRDAATYFIAEKRWNETHQPVDINNALHNEVFEMLEGE